MNGGNEKLEEVLRLGENRPILRRPGFRLLIGLILLLAVGAYVLFRPAAKTSVSYKTTAVQKGNLVVTVTATGTLEPVNKVEVGTEVSGTIRKVLVDYNDSVLAGQILATIDTSKLAPQVVQAEAALASAEANLLEATARMLEAQNNYQRLQKNWDDTGGRVPSRQELETAEFGYKIAQATEAAAKAEIVRAQAILDANRSDLAKATIRSPINGIILVRNVEAGQTVAASLQTPVLFTLAEDLTKMTLYVDVDEADIGQVKTGQQATFTVDAYPDREFSARIIQARFAAKTENNVVTYQTLLEVDNGELLLRPGMTATAEIVVKSITDALLVPNAALRFEPGAQDMSAPGRKTNLIASLLSRRSHPPAGQRKNDVAGRVEQSRIWTLKLGRPMSVSVKTGGSDGSMTEIIGEGIQAGLQVIVDATRMDK